MLCPSCNRETPTVLVSAVAVGSSLLPKGRAKSATIVFPFGSILQQLWDGSSTPKLLREQCGGKQILQVV